MMGRIHGRITREDIKEAQCRRWNGRSRVTTDWINLYHVGRAVTYLCGRYSRFAGT